MNHARLEGRVVGFPVGKELVLEMALSMPVKCTTPPNQVPLCTVKHLLDEAARIQFRKSVWRFTWEATSSAPGRLGEERSVLCLTPSSQFCSWLRAAHI